MPLIYSLVSLCVRARMSACLLQLFASAAMPDQQATHLPVYNSHHAMLRCSQTPLFLSHHSLHSPLFTFSLFLTHTNKQTRVHTDAVNCIIVKTGLTKWEAKREGNRATGYVRRGVGRICLQKPNNVVGGKRKKTERESEKTISVFSNIKSLFVSVYPLLICLFLPSWREIQLSQRKGSFW